MQLLSLIEERLGGLNLCLRIHYVFSRCQHLQISIAHRKYDELEGVAVGELCSFQALNGGADTLVLRETGCGGEICARIEIGKWADDGRYARKSDSLGCKIDLLYALSHSASHVRQQALQCAPTLSSRSGNSLLCEECTEVRFEPTVDRVFEGDGDDLVGGFFPNHTSAERILGQGRRCCRLNRVGCPRTLQGSC